MNTFLKRSAFLFTTAMATVVVAPAVDASSVVPRSVTMLPLARFIAKTDEVAQVRSTMRKLWEDHIVYTRSWIISAVADLPDADVIAERLMQNQKDIGDAIKVYYGDAAGDRLTALLQQRITLAIAVVSAAKADSRAKLDDGQKRWVQNGKDIASMLAKANPNWHESELASMLHKHLQLTTDEAVARLHGDWAADIRAYDAGHDHMMRFADLLTDGIAKQFPYRFISVAQQ